MSETVETFAISAMRQAPLHVLAAAVEQLKANPDSRFAAWAEDGQQIEIPAAAAIALGRQVLMQRCLVIGDWPTFFRDAARCHPQPAEGQAINLADWVGPSSQDAWKLAFHLSGPMGTPWFSELTAFEQSIALELAACWWEDEDPAVVLEPQAVPEQ